MPKKIRQAFDNYLSSNQVLALQVSSAKCPFLLRVPIPAAAPWPSLPGAAAVGEEHLSGGGSKLNVRLNPKAMSIKFHVIQI